MRSRHTALIVVLAILLLFFLQSLSDFIQSIYAFGLLVTAFTPQLAAVLLLFSPVVLLFVRVAPSRSALIALGLIAVLGRLLEPLLDPGGRLVACGISVGAFMLLFPLMIASASPSEDDRAWSAAWALLLAILPSVFFRVSGSGLDVSEVGFAQLIAWAMAAIAAWLVWKLARRAAGRVGGNESLRPYPDHANFADTSRAGQPAPLPPSPAQPLSHEDRRAASLRSLASGPLSSQPNPVPSPRIPAASPLAPDFWHITGLCLGLASVIVMGYFAFGSPTVMARWTGYSYDAIVVMLVGVWFIAALAASWFSARVGRPLLLAWNALFVLMLVLTIVPHQVAFPAGEEAYPFIAGAVSPLWQVALYLMLLLSPVIFVDFAWFVRGLADARPSLRQLGGGFALAALFLLVMVFLQVFTTIYDYARPIGPLFRDRFGLVYLIAGLGLVGTVMAAGGDEEGYGGGSKERKDVGPSDGRARNHVLGDRAVGAEGEAVPRPHNGRGVVWAAGTMVALIGIALVLTRPRIAQPSGGALRVMTYNIQQGFDKVGNAALPAQLAAIRRVEPDILGLQESDTARVANGNVDAVRYFANHLGMYSYYGPPTTAGTFGIALLSKYPIQRAWTFYMASAAEQTACIQAVITANGKTYNVFVTHLGNGGPMVQLVDVLHETLGLPNVILMGDFNFDPTTLQYALASQTLADAWLLRWPAGRQLTGGAEGRIDQLFVSPDMLVTEAEYVPAPASDHPYLWAVVK